LHDPEKLLPSVITALAYLMLATETRISDKISQTAGSG